MRKSFLRVVLFLGFCASFLGQPHGAASQTPGPQSPEPQKAPAPPLLPLGSAGPSASDSVTPVPEGGGVANSAYTNPYFGVSYPIPTGWSEGNQGPPPSDNGYYVLAAFRQTTKGGTMTLLARDLFFTPAPANNAMEMLKHTKDTLNPDTLNPVYQVERPPTPVEIANRSFARLDYVAPVVELHWYVLATEIRCHSVEFVLNSRSPQLLESVIQQMKQMKLPAGANATSGTGGGDVPVCVKDYATGDSVIHKVDPVIPGRRFNTIPVRLMIDKNGNVKHVHVISAFPEQGKPITDALLQWKFKPYLRDGQPVEVETGLTLGSPPPVHEPRARTKSPR